jgi:hypothetical protein
LERSDLSSSKERVPNLTDCLSKTERLTMAEKCLDNALDLKLKGNEHFKSHEFKEAIDLYTAAIEACPSHR